MTSISTKLNAVNTILSVVGEPPINSLTGDAATNSDAVLAQNILDEISREVQSQGWHFNTVNDVPMAPDTSGTILIGNTVVRLDSNDTKYDLVLRGTTLYDRKNRTSTFTDSIKCTVVYLLDFTELPEPAKRLITIRSARVFQDRLVGAQEHHAFTLRDEQMALFSMREFEMDTADPSIFDNDDVYRIINRPSVYTRVS